MDTKRLYDTAISYLFYLPDFSSPYFWLLLLLGMMLGGTLAYLLFKRGWPYFQTIIVCDLIGLSLGFMFRYYHLF
jgi:hypothetical protein